MGHDALDASVGGLKPSIGDTAAYIRTLGDCLYRTTRAEDRSAYRDHLAEAAQLVALLDENAPDEQISAWLEQERRRYGRGFLSGDEGAAAGSAFETFASRFDSPS